jgi:hypothetical protein
MPSIKLFSIAKISLVISAITLGSLGAQAALYDRGNGMIYDSTQNITWLQDANYAQTSNYFYADSYGQMNWSQANTWANNLVYGGFSNWRLASAKPNGTNMVCQTNYATCPGYYNGTYDYSYNNTRSEIGHLFFELGNKARFDKNGISQSIYGVRNTDFVDPKTNQNVSFFNVKNDIYWEAETYAPNSAYAWAFITDRGFQHSGYSKTNYYLYAWAVADGDIAAPKVPVPAATWLMGSGLVGLAGIARRKK